MAAAPFKIMRNLVVVEGGHSSSQWVVEAKEHGDGSLWVNLQMKDRKLARALGLDCSLRAPFQETTLLQHMTNLRNAEVDRAISKAMHDDDPMADAEPATDSPTKDRTKAFNSANVSQVITLSLLGFTTGDGAKVPAREVKVYTAPRRDASVTMELTESNLDWLANAIHVEWGNQAIANKKRKSIASELSGLPILSNEGCMYTSRADRVAIFANYRTIEGAWKKHQVSLGNMANMTDDMVGMHVKAVEDSVAEWVTTNHHEVPSNNV